jgi:hypothetical protein
MRTPNGEYPEYHSSADNLSLFAPKASHIRCCPSSNGLGQSAVFGTEALARLGWSLGGFQPMLQSSLIWLGSLPQRYATNVRRRPAVDRGDCRMIAYTKRDIRGYSKGSVDVACAVASRMTIA